MEKYIECIVEVERLLQEKMASHGVIYADTITLLALTLIKLEIFFLQKNNRSYIHDNPINNGLLLSGI